MVRGAVRSPDGVDEIVDDTDADAIPRRRHGTAGVPEIGGGIEAIHGVRILVAVGRIVATADGVEQTADHRRAWEKTDKMALIRTVCIN